MPYSVVGTDVRGVNTVSRKTPELALRKARELIKRGCYDVRITTPEGRTADSDDLARVYRLDLAQDSEMISPTIPG